jgi:hypothetical protein
MRLGSTPTLLFPALRCSTLASAWGVPGDTRHVHSGIGCPHKPRAGVARHAAAHHARAETMSLSLSSQLPLDAVADGLRTIALELTRLALPSDMPVQSRHSRLILDLWRSRDLERMLELMAE